MIKSVDSSWIWTKTFSICVPQARALTNWATSYSSCAIIIYFCRKILDIHKKNGNFYQRCQSQEHQPDYFWTYINNFLQKERCWCRNSIGMFKIQVYIQYMYLYGCKILLWCDDFVWQVLLGGGRYYFLPNDTADPENPKLFGGRTDNKNLADVGNCGTF